MFLIHDSFFEIRIDRGCELQLHIPNSYTANVLFNPDFCIVEFFFNTGNIFRVFEIKLVGVEERFIVVSRGNRFIEFVSSQEKLTVAQIIEFSFWNDCALFSFGQRSLIFKSYCNRAASIPLFWTKSSESFILSNSHVPLYSASSRKFSRVGILESLLFDHTLGNRTLFDDIFQQSAGHFLSLDLKSNQVSSARYNSISLSHNQAQKAKSDIFEGTSTLEKILLSSLTNIDKDFKLGIPLSGGLDSRAIVYQSYQKFKFETLTYGQEHSFEFSNADAVAKALDLVNHKYILDNKHYLNTHIESCVYSGGISHLMHSHLSSAIASNSFKGVVIGFMGDPIAGSAQHINFQGKGFEDFADALLKYRKIGLKDLKNIFSTSDEAEIVEDLRDLYIDIKDLCPHERLLEYYFIVIRQSKLISSIFNSILSQKIQIFYPFMDDRFARFFLELGYDDRLNRKFYKECIREMESKFFSNFGLDIAFPKTRLYGMNAKAARTCQSLVELISMGKFSLSNPFLTENPNSVLNNCLKNIYSESLSVCEANGIINQELAKKIQGPFLTTAWTHSAFRIISIKKMIDYFSI